jgi:hypothetical protein
MTKSTIGDLVDETQGERCKLFWEHLIARHPQEANYAKPTKLAYRWREIPKRRLVVARCISLAGNQVLAVVGWSPPTTPAAYQCQGNRPPPRTRLADWLGSTTLQYVVPYAHDAPLFRSGTNVDEGRDAADFRHWYLRMCCAARQQEANEADGSERGKGDHGEKASIIKVVLLIELVEAHSGIGGVYLKVECCRLDGPLLVAGQPGEAISERVAMRNSIDVGPKSRGFSC